MTWGLVCAEAVGDVNLHGHHCGCHHDAVIIPLYMYIPISLTRLLLYFRKLTVLILLKSKLLFVVYFTYPYKRLMMQEVTQANGIVWVCFYTCEKRVFFFCSRLG